jgi:UDP-3-O-[3-hydroxymyristoyl] glucosamine N-acyltransferase
MKLDQNKTLKEIATLISANYKGTDDFIVSGINEIHMVTKGDLTFVDHPKYYDKALNSAATTILINKDIDCPEGKALIFSEDPFRDYNFLTRYFRPSQFHTEAIHASVKVGVNSIIRANVSIGANTVIGKNCIIHPNVTIYDNCIIGNNVEIHAGSVIGADAFYFKKYKDTGFNKMHSCGRVVLDDFVEIGAGCTIDKGVSGDTYIGKGSKLDNMVHVGHDTVVGKNCLFAAQVGIAGCVVIEDDVILWGQVGVQKDLKIGKGAVVLGQSGVPKSLEGGKTYFGSPTQDARDKMKELAMVKRIPEIIEFLKNNGNA